MTRAIGTWVPVEIVFEDGLRLQYAGYVCSVRHDGCYEIVFPYAQCLMSRNDKPLRVLPKKEGLEAVSEYIPQYNSVLKLDKPLMPRRKKRGDNREGFCLTGRNTT